MIQKGSLMQEKIMETLRGKDHQKGYSLCKQICAESADSQEYYEVFDDFVMMLSETGYKAAPNLPSCI